MKGHIVSRTLAEAGLTPIEGMQVYIYKEIATIRHVIGRIVSLNHNGKELQSVWTVSDDFRTLLVEYEIHHPKVIPGTNAVRGKNVPAVEKKTLPLKHSDWQTAVKQGLVDSGKQVEFEIQENYNLEDYIAADMKNGNVARLILRQDDVEKHFERIASETEDPYSRGFSDGLKAAKAERQCRYTGNSEQKDNYTVEEWIQKEKITCAKFGECLQLRDVYDLLAKQQQKLYTEEEVRQLAWESYHVGRAGLQVGKALNDWWNENKHKHETDNT
jgi:hypothetical protein